MRVWFRNRNNNKTYPVDEGAVVKICYNETLDSATIRISNVSEADRLDTVVAFDSAILSDDDVLANHNYALGIKYFVVDTITETMVCLSPKIYTYDISLFSETKLLENVSLPNLKITQLKDGAKRTIKYYLEEYLNKYGEKRRYNGQWEDRWTWDTDWNSHLLDVFDVECPEMQWNQPTLREVLNDLMMVKDCIVVLRNNKIRYLNISKINNDLTQSKYTNKINYIQRSHSSEDYVSELKMNLVNVMQSDENVRKTVTKAEWVYFTPESGQLITSDNLCLKTQFPILKINKLDMVITGMPVGISSLWSALDGHKASIVRIDLCKAKTYVDSNYNNMVVEKKEYDVKPVLYSTNDLQTYNTLEGESFHGLVGSSFAIEFHKFDDMVQYQNTLLYYSRGDNVIRGFGDISKSSNFLWYWWNTTTLIQLINASIFGCTKKTDFDYSSDTVINEDIYTIMPNSDRADYYNNVAFRIEYETTTDAVFTASKDFATEHKKVIIDNQTNSYVDCYSQGFLEYMKANRLGNKMLMINSRYLTEEISQNMPLIKIGDYYDDNVIYEAEYQVYRNAVNINAYATKDYVLRNYFTGVKAKVRSWKILDGNEALSRYELTKFYFEFSFSPCEEIDLPKDISHYMLSPLYDEDNEPISYIGWKTTSFDGSTTYPANDSQKVYLMETSSRVIGNSLVFSISEVDNYEVSKYVDLSVSGWSQNDSGGCYKPSSSIGGIPTNMYRYVDENGEISSERLFLSPNLYFSHLGTNKISDDIETGWKIPDYGLIPSPEMGGVYEFYREAYQKPMGTLDAIPSAQRIIDLNIPIHKDNGEILVNSIQFEICRDTKDIVFTADFVKRQKCVRTVQNNVIDNGSYCKVYVGSASDWLDNDIYESYRIAKNLGPSNLHITFPDDANEVNIGNGFDYPNETYFITTQDDVLLIAVKGKRAFYLNMLLDRDKNIYDNNGEIVGTIKVQ